VRWLITLALVTTPAFAAAPKAEDVAAYRALAAVDGRVATIGYRLAAANTPFCKDKFRNPGWVLHSYRQYPDRDVAQAAFDFPTPLAISALVGDGPAATAGLKVGDGLANMPGGLWIGGELINHKPSAELVDNVNNRMRELFSGEGPVKLSFDRSPDYRDSKVSVTLNPPSVCMSDFWVDTSSKVDAGADGERVRVTTGLTEFAANDNELAAAIAHELAHNLLGHRARLNGLKKGKTKAILATEIEADRLSVWLMANAGYDTSAALTFIERYGRKYDPLLSDGTHPGWKKRRDNMRIEIDAISSIQVKDGLRDPPLLAAYRSKI
jgi:beta-barrel assembly-enhancing protease